MTKKIKGMLAQHGVKHSELATRLGVSAPTLSFKLNGKSDWWLGELAIIQEVLQETTGKYYTLDTLTKG